MGIKKSPQASLKDQTHIRKRDRDLAGLMTALQDTDPKARRWAAHDLAELKTEEIGQASHALLKQLNQETNTSVREAIFTSLTLIGDGVAVDGLVGCLSSEDTVLRNEAIEALKQLPDEIAPMMQQLLLADEPDLRIFAVNVLESLRHPKVEQWLIDVIENDSHVNVCATAVDLLGEVGSSAARPALEGLRVRFANEPYICFAADLALKRLGEE